jgi:hypothetical protein
MSEGAGPQSPGGREFSRKLFDAMVNVSFVGVTGPVVFNRGEAVHDEQGQLLGACAGRCCVLVLCVRPRWDRLGFPYESCLFLSKC